MRGSCMARRSVSLRPAPRGVGVLLATLLLALGLVSVLAPEVVRAEDEGASATAGPIDSTGSVDSSDVVDDPSGATFAPAYSVDAPPSISSPVALVIDRDTGLTLFEQNADEARTPASMTKVLTALVVLENADLDDVVTVEDVDFEHVTPESTVAGLKAGDSLTIRDLLACLLIPSGNDASYVLARAVGGDWETFVGMMNERAAELGCTSTHFSDPCGLAEDNHYTTACDLVLIFEAAMRHPEFCQISASRTWDIPATGDNPVRTLENTNHLLDPDGPAYMGDAIVAGKTGFTYDAGKCLVVGAQRDGMNLVAVVMGASPEPDDSGVTVNFYDMKSLLEWGFGAWETGNVVSVGDVVASAEVTLSADGDSVDGLSADSIFATVPRGTTISDLTVETTWSAPFQAPVGRGDSLGQATISLGDRVLGTVGVIAASTMELSIADFVSWWLTSDPSHMTLVVATASAIVAVVVVVVVIVVWRRRVARVCLEEAKASSGRHFK